MPALKFEKLLCGPSVDMFRKDFVHENLWEVEHADNQKGNNYTNNLYLNRDGHMTGSTCIKAEMGPVNAELKMCNSGEHYMEVSAVSPQYPTMKVLSKYVFNVANSTNGCELAAENVCPVNTSQVKILPFARDFSAFSIFNYKMDCCQVFCGTEVTGKNCALFSNYALGLGYKRQRDDRTYQFSARLFGERGTLAKSLVGNIYTATAHGDAQNAMSVALEHDFKSTNTKLMFAGLWHLTAPGNTTPAFVKGKCDTDGQVALSLFQRFNSNLAAIIGVEFNGKESINPAAANYGFKLLLS
ncbi:eukaryotic porin, putative [Babesia ovis]|uniref:Eukaryotic porin, putative n=1 Tax=Babesia ovis TaxID=5869 RepID=A0A9W5WU42_BABOV|nr:eukaryotic porin, putative [Babesia ovis]